MPGARLVTDRKTLPADNGAGGSHAPLKVSPADNGAEKGACAQTDVMVIPADNGAGRNMINPTKDVFRPLVP